VISRQSPYVVKLTDTERKELESRARKYTSPYRDVIRAKVVLLAAQGLSNEVIASRLDTPRQIVSKWRKRFCLARLPGLEEEPRSGRPARFSPSVVVQVKALACELPARRGLPLSRFSRAEIRREVLVEGRVGEIRGATLWRRLSQDALRPWRFRRWIFPRDPAFFTKAERILDLYEGSGTASPSLRRIASWALTRRRASKSDAAALCPCPRNRTAPSTWSMNTSGVALTLIWRLGMCAGPECLGAVQRRPASLPSTDWWPKSWVSSLLSYTACAVITTTCQFAVDLEKHRKER
jgi:transposase